MKLEIAIETDDQTTPVLARLKRGMKGTPNKLNSFIGRAVVGKIRDHLIRIAPSSHATADRLNARPTGHLERNLEAIRPALLAEEVQIFIPIPGIRRAFEDVTIRARAGKYLTIPAIAESYGRRARSFQGLRFVPFKSGAKGLVKFGPAEVGANGKKERPMQVFYWLKEQVTQRQDRGLMPSDDALLQACESGAEDYLENELFNTQNRS